MNYQDCVDNLKNYKKFNGKIVESDGELLKVKHALIVPVDKSQLRVYAHNYIEKSQSAEIVLSSFMNKDLQILLEAYRLSDGSIAFLEPSKVKIVS